MKQKAYMADLKIDEKETIIFHCKLSLELIDKLTQRWVDRPITPVIDPYARGNQKLLYLF